jgi:hypothetical protein
MGHRKPNCAARIRTSRACAVRHRSFAARNENSVSHFFFAIPALSALNVLDFAILAERLSAFPVHALCTTGSQLAKNFLALIVLL